MLTDAHYHPLDLADIFPEAEHERKKMGILAAASASSIEEYSHNENTARYAKLAGAAPLSMCLGIHPQLPALKTANGKCYTKIDAEIFLETLFSLAETRKIDAIGECGFDLYNTSFKETEILQDFIFARQLEIAVRFELPVVLHIRKAIHKIFLYTNTLSKCEAVIFHSWSGTFEDAKTILSKGVNAYFSFGNTVMLNHKHTMRSCALLSSERLLTETDAPYQPRRGQTFSIWADLPLILQAITALRLEAGNNITVKELEEQVETNFKNVYIN